MNYRGVPLYTYFSKVCSVEVICARPGRNTPEEPNFRYTLPYRRPRTSLAVAYRFVQSVHLFFLVFRELLSERYDIIRSISFVPTLVSVIQPRRVPVVANISDFYSDLYEKFRMPFPSIVVHIIRALEKLAARRSRLLMVDTEPQRKKWVSLGADPSTCIILGHGIPKYETLQNNEAKKLRSSLGFPENSRVIFYIGDISELDGVDVLIKALPRILESMPETRVLIIGSGPRSYMKSLKELSDSLGVSNSIAFIERIPHEHITKYGSAASLCVAPFRLTATSSTSLPNKILEYLALGKPIVSSLGEGVSSVLGKSISYARPGDYESLANSIIACLQAAHSSPPDKIDQETSWDFIVRREFELICSLTGHLTRGPQSMIQNRLD